ncbi:MAG: type II secretion system protein [Gammaproteobacteria bacterium]
MKSNGVSLLEIMMVIAVSALVMIIAVNYFINVRMNERIDHTVIQIQNLYNAGIKFFHSMPLQAPTGNKSVSYVGKGTTDITTMLYEGDYISSADIMSPWGQCTVVSHKMSGACNSIKMMLNSGSTSKLEINLPKMPAKACSAIQSRLQDPFPNASFSQCSQAVSNGITIDFPISS